MSKGHRTVLGDKAPENPWDEMIMLRQEVFRLRKENDGLLELTRLIDEHPEEYEGPCLCKLCMSYADPE